MRRRIPGIVPALSETLGGLDALQKRLLCEDIGESYLLSQQLDGLLCGGCSNGASWCRLRDRFLDGILALAINDASAAETLTSHDLVAVLAVHAGRQGLRANEVLPLLRQAGNHFELLANEARVPASYMGVAIADGLQHGIAPTAALANALVTHSMDLGDLELDEISLARCLRLLDALDGNRLETAIARLLLPLAQAMNSAQLRSVLDRLPSPMAAACVVSAAGPAGATIPESLSELCGHYAITLLTDQRDRFGAEQVWLAARLLALSPSSDDLLGSRLLHALTVPGRESSLEIARSAERLERADLRSAVASSAIRRAVESLQHERDVTRLWNVQRRCNGDASPLSAMRRFLDAAVLASSALGSEKILWWLVTTYAEHDPVAVARSGVLRDDDVMRSCLELAECVSHDRLSDLEVRLKDARQTHAGMVASPGRAQTPGRSEVAAEVARALS